jgi:hypothetical protein
MYCPGCATQNLEEVKFCRVCGINLASVQLALAEQSTTLPTRDSKIARLTANSLNHRRQGMKKVIEGTGLVAGSTLVGAALGIFSNQADWIMIWLVFGAWMAVIGMLSLATGIGKLIESKYLSRQVQQIDDAPLRMAPPTEFRKVAAPVTSPRLTPVTSVTEHTTELLNETPGQNGER